MILKEFRIVMPLSVSEYKIAQLYAVAEASKNETGGGEGIEVRTNEPYSGHPLLGNDYAEGQYTHKVYYIKSKVPSFVRLLAPEGSLEFHEKAWNAYPYCRTVVTNPLYMKENFEIKIETMHVGDRGESHNVHNLPPELLKKREVIHIDIANSAPVIERGDYKENEDPTKFRSEKAGRGPLGGSWMKSVEPVMCCYKLVTCEFKWFGLQGRVEKMIQNQELRLFTNFHRQVFCWMDQYHGLTIEDIRRIEEKTKLELEEQRHKGNTRGMVGTE